jgi:hypothetical protein
VRRQQNSRPEIRLSSLPPASITFAGGVASVELCPVGSDRFEYVEHRAGGATRRPMVRCPEPGCGCWARLVRSVLQPHRGGPNGRCAASFQRIKVDLTPDQHRVRLDQVQRVADNRRATQVHGVGPAPTLPALCRMGRAAA